MLIPTEDAPHLRAWLLQKLPEFATDTDTDILADYLLALLSTLQEVSDEVRKNIESELADVLEPEKIAPLVDEVLRNVEFKSYLPGALPLPPKGARLQPPQKTEPEVKYEWPGTEFRDWKDHKKRSYRDAVGDDEAGPGGPGQFAEGRAYKQARRGGGSFPQRGGHMPPRNGMNGPPTGPASMFNPAATSFEPSFGAGFDPSQGPQFPYGPTPGQNSRQKPCRDYQTKGFCTRGHACKYGHGNQPISMGHADPSNGARSAQEEQLQEMLKMMLSQNAQQMQEMMDAFHNSTRGGGRAGKGGRGGSSKRGRRRASISADGPVDDQSRSTIVVEGIPKDHLNEESVREFFADFGTITELSVKPEKRLAIIKYEAWSSANAAYRSPKVIFDNRFVRVFWHRETDADGATHPEEPEIDMEEFMKKQEEAQRRHEENMQKKAEIDKEREDLEQQHRDLLARQREVRQKLHAKLSGTEGTAGTSTSDALRAQLAALEEEAMLLGLDPDADDVSIYSGGDFRGRGRGRGRARGGHGYYTPRGRGRGANRGRDDIHAAYASYSLDNRPRVVAISGADFTDTSRDEALRQHLFGVGEFTDIEATPARAHVTFKDRKTAEKFFYGAALGDSAIPGVEGKLELAWVANKSLPPAPAPVTVKQEEEDTTMVNAPAVAPASAPPAGRDNKFDMDYEQAEEGEWGID